VRNYITIEVVGPAMEEAGEIIVPAGYGTNLRTELQRQNFKMYDTRMPRFDSPYQTGDCGGEGTCGTCMVAVLSGKELLNDRLPVEAKGLAKQGAPANYRWSCRARLSAGSNKTGKLKVMLRPQTKQW
jgi:ferredoxin